MTTSISWICLQCRAAKAADWQQNFIVHYSLFIIFRIFAKWIADSSQRSMKTMNESRKNIEVVAAIIIQDGRLFATQRGYGEWKDWWEFPGGKIEPGESPKDALKREIREELATEIEVGNLLTTVEYDYPKFHLTMHCYLCDIIRGQLSLLEHEDARWLTKDELDGVKWLPADVEVIKALRL